MKTGKKSAWERRIRFSDRTGRKYKRSQVELTYNCNRPTGSTGRKNLVVADTFHSPRITMVSILHWVFVVCFLFGTLGWAQVVNENSDPNPALLKLAADNGPIMDLLFIPEASDENNPWVDSHLSPINPYLVVKRNNGGRIRTRGKKQREIEVLDLPFWAARGKKARLPYSSSSSPQRGKKDSEEDLLNTFWAARGKRSRNGGSVAIEDLPFWAARGRRSQNGVPTNDLPFWAARGKRAGSATSIDDFPFWAARGKKADDDFVDNESNLTNSDREKRETYIWPRGEHTSPPM